MQGRIQRGGPGVGKPPSPPWNFGKKVVIRFVIGTGLILHSIYVNYSHKSKKTSWLEHETLTFLVYGLHPLKSGNQKYHIIRRVRFRWETPPPPPPRERYLDPRMKCMLGCKPSQIRHQL